MLLHESFHPDLLRNALDRDRFFDRLWVGIEYRPYLSRVIPAERRDMQNGDIPMFTTRPDSRDIWSSAGERIEDFLEEPGLDLARRHISQLSEADLERQLWFINASLTTLSADVDGAQWGNYELEEAEAVADQERLQSAARAVGERLQALALYERGDISWIGVTLVNEKNWTLMPLGIDLYNGGTGVMLFLAYLGSVTGDERYTELARTALKTLRSTIESIKPTFKLIGGFDGLGGWIYALTHLSALWDDRQLLAEAEETVGMLPELIEQDVMLDVISGTAGCLLSLLSLYRHAPSAQTLATAIKCGNHLLGRAQLSRDGVAWRTPISGKEPLAGFSHGAAGIAYALAQLSAVSGDEGYRSAAQHAMIYERAIFSQEAGNWPDLRLFEDLPEGKDNQAEDNFMLAWCHGAPGIGMARLGLLEYFDDAAIRDEINTALKSTVAGGFGHNHSLCHGDLGNLELLLQASRTLDEPQWRSRVERLTSSIVQSIDRKGWLCGIPLGVESPGLMTGLAGIGYELLRLSDPERVPSVMLLAPPARKG
jgi:type 2 lantibiotic biosynthesis protein LanM